MSGRKTKKRTTSFEPYVGNVTRDGIDFTDWRGPVLHTARMKLERPSDAEYVIELCLQWLEERRVDLDTSFDGVDGRLKRARGVE